MLTIVEDFSCENPQIALYGLPVKVRFCKSCVISNQRPRTSIEHQNDGNQIKKAISFSSSGICDACHVREAKLEIDWLAREKELRELCDRYRRSDGSYDCLVPGSGGKDSFGQAHFPSAVPLYRRHDRAAPQPPPPHLHRVCWGMGRRCTRTDSYMYSNWGLGGIRCGSWHWCIVRSY